MMVYSVMPVTDRKKFVSWSPFAKLMIPARRSSNHTLSYLQQAQSTNVLCGKYIEHLGVCWGWGRGESGLDAV